MKLYNLTYDCNNPVVQQINVPTNTDYKVGVKVLRDGQVQNLSPESVTLGTLSADADKTNGYVTFTLSSGDSASYTQEMLGVEKGYDYNDTYKTSGQFGSTTPDPNPSEVILTAKDLGLDGQLQKAEDYASVNMYYWIKATTPSADLSAWTHRPNIFYPNDSTSTLRNGAAISKTTGDNAVLIYRFNQDYTATE